MARQARLTSLDRRILALAIPALGTLAADPLLSLVDTAFVSRLGTIPLAALGVDTALFSMAFFAFNFLAYATTPMVARRVGAGDETGAGHVVVQALMLAVVLGVASTLVLVMAAEWLIGFMQAPDAVVEPAVSYLRIRALAAPAMLLVTAGHGSFRGLLDTRTPLLVALGVNALNVVLDPLLIFTAGWGLEGAAIATAVAQWSGAITFVVLLRRVGKQRGWTLARPSLRAFLPLMRAGGIITVRTLFLTGTLTAATAVAAWFGTAEVAAHQVMAQAWLLLAMTVDSLAIAAQAMVGDELGRSDSVAASTVAARLGRWGLGVGLALGIVVFVGRSALAAFFSPDPEVGRLIEQAAVVAALMQPLAALVFVADGVYLGLLQLSYLLYSTAAGAVVGGLLMLVAVRADLGLTGVWWAITGMIVARLAVLTFAYRRALARAV